MSFDRLATPASVVLGALIIGLAIVFHASTSRYQIAPTSDMLRIDTRTGEVKTCQPGMSDDGKSYHLECGL